MRVLGARETAALLPFGAVADAVRDVMAAERAGVAEAPERTALSLRPGDALLLMPARDEAVAVVKLVTVHPENAERGLPVVQGIVVVMDAATGRRLALLDGATVTARRTPAVSLLAARHLARRPDGPLWVVGAGTQGRTHLEALVEAFAIRRAFITSRTESSAAALAARAAELGVEATVTDHHAEEPRAAATMIVTATTSETPVIPSGVRDDAFVMAVGAWRPEMRELPPELVRAATVVVDTPEGARAEAGDLIHALEDWSGVLSLREALERPRPPEGPVVFKSVGHALWDLAAARVAVAGGSGS